MAWNMFAPFNRKDKSKDQEECDDQRRANALIHGMYQEDMWRDVIRRDFGIRCRMECLEYVPLDADSEAPTVTLRRSCKTRIRFAIGDDLADYMEALYQNHKDEQKDMNPCLQECRYEVEIPRKNTRFVLYPVHSNEVQDLRWQDYERHCSARLATGNSVPLHDR